MEALERDFPKPWLVLSNDNYHSCLTKAVQKGITGGALYDALIAATVVEHDATLLSADRRAQPTYEAMGIKTEFVFTD